MNNKFFALLCTLISIFFLQDSQAQTWQWAKSGVGTSEDWASGLAIDAEKNVFVAGRFSDSIINFGSSTLVNNGRDDVFLVKYDSSGNEQWAKSAGGSNFDRAWGAATDATGNIYIAGEFYSPSITFGTITLPNTTGGDNNMFITKYNTSGIVLWAKCADSGSCWANAVATDVSKNVYVLGGFFSGALKFSTTILNNPHFGSNVFIVKYDSSGNIIWAKSMCDNVSVHATGLSIDATGNIYVTGWFDSPTLTIGTALLTDDSVGTHDVFLAKYSPAGNVLWAQSAGGKGYDHATSVANDMYNDVYITGYFQSSTMYFGTTSITNTDTSGFTEDVFLAKYDSTGSIIWAKNAGGSNMDEANSVTTDIAGNIYITGNYNSHNIVFGTDSLTNVSGIDTDDIFIAKYNQTGNVVWAKTAGGLSEDMANCVVLDATGSIYIAGLFFSPTIIFGTTTLTDGGLGNPYVARLSDIPLSSSIELKNTVSILLFPNPTNTQLNIITEDGVFSSILISNVFGQTVASKKILSTSTKIDVSALPNGIYTITLKGENGIEVRKFVKM